MMPKAAKDLFDPKLFLAKVGEGKAILKFDRNQVVFAQGEVADTVFYIQKGRIKVLVVSEQGKEAVVGILEPGQFFGEGCLNGHPLRISTTTAMDECLITAIAKDAMLAALQSEPSWPTLEFVQRPEHGAVGDARCLQPGLQRSDRTALV